MRVSTKGQVTIPIDIRQEFGLFPNTEVEFLILSDGVLIKKHLTNPNRRNKILSSLSGKATSGMSTDEIMELTRKW